GPAPPPASQAGEAEELLEAPALGVETELGGVFYLLNLLLYLGLYGDFTRPLDRALPLDPWEGLALLARRLLGGRDDDPLWRLLEQLATPSEFRPPAAWRVPREWLEPFEEGRTWRWSAAGGTLRLVHPAGFTAVAVRRTPAPPRDQLARELRRLGIDP